jgi:hypothetical protein
MILVFLIILAVNAPDCWGTIFKSIGALNQVMISVCYVLYFSAMDQMSTYDLNDPTERQQYQNMKVLWGLYRSNEFFQNERSGQADDVASILFPIIPLFAIIVVCFVQKELDKWYQRNFNLTIPLNPEVKHEIRKFEVKEDLDFERRKKEVEDLVKEGTRNTLDQPR